MLPTEKNSNGVSAGAGQVDSSHRGTLWGKSPKSAAKRTIADKDICLNKPIECTKLDHDWKVGSVFCWSNPTTPSKCAQHSTQNRLLLFPSRCSSISKADAPDQWAKVCLPSMGREFPNWNLPRHHNFSIWVGWHKLWRWSERGHWFAPWGVRPWTKIQNDTWIYVKINVVLISWLLWWLWKDLYSRMDVLATTSLASNSNARKPESKKKAIYWKQVLRGIYSLYNIWYILFICVSIICLYMYVTCVLKLSQMLAMFGSYFPTSAGLRFK